MTEHLNILHLVDCQNDDPARKAVNAVLIAADRLMKLVDFENPHRGAILDRMASLVVVRALVHAATQIQVAASCADVRRIANEQIEEEDATRTN